MQRTFPSGASVSHPQCFVRLNSHPAGSPLATSLSPSPKTQPASLSCDGPPGAEAQLCAQRCARAGEGNEGGAQAHRLVVVARHERGQHLRRPAPRAPHPLRPCPVPPRRGPAPRPLRPQQLLLEHPHLPRRRHAAVSQGNPTAHTPSRARTRAHTKATCRAEKRSQRKGAAAKTKRTMSSAR